MKITIIGTGYVGLANAVLLSQNHNVIALDIDENKVDLINNKKSPIKDEYITEYLNSKDLNLRATLDKKEAIEGADFIVIATPTDYDEVTNNFDTSTVESCIEDIIQYNNEATVIIKSTIPVGYTEDIINKYNKNNIVFSPEFLREGKALYDNLYPSRIIMGSHSEEAKLFASFLVEGALKENIDILFTESTEAEAIKLFSNTYLAMRISYFNELDTYAESKGLDTKDIITGVGLDPRIGQHYNNPSFGYGGYCLPKDTKQLLANYNDVPQNLIKAIVESNSTRKEHVSTMILEKNPKTVGIYRLTMKSGSDNFRQSAIQDVINNLLDNNINIVIFEPELDEETFNNLKVYTDFGEFADDSDLIIANRMSKTLRPFSDKVYTRDIFNRD